MNMMRSDFDVLELDAKLIDSSKVIGGYIYLSKEIAEEKKQAQKERRMRLLFVALIASAAVFLWNQPIFVKEYQHLEAYHAAPALGEVLSDTTVEQLMAETPSSVSQADLELSVDVPEDIIQFIDAGIAIENQRVFDGRVVLEERKILSSDEITIGKLLASGDDFFKRDRLMSPPKNNAHARYEEVLAIDPTNTVALVGIEKIVDRYISLAQSVINKDEAYKVPALIQNAYLAGNKYMDVSVLIEPFSQYLSNDSVFSQIAAAPQVTDNTVTDKVVLYSQLNNKERKDNGVYHDNVLFDADRKIAQTAYQLYVKGDVNSAEKALQNFTQLSGFWGQSNDLLLRIYLSESKIAEAEHLIYNNKALSTYQFAEKAARVMMTRGDSQGALDMLAAYRPEFLANKDYYMLMASLYTKVGNYQRSVYWYRQLLSVNHDDARLWLGLAVSLDAINNVNDAMKAFDYARLYAHNRSGVKNYINERQLALAN